MHELAPIARALAGYRPKRRRYRRRFERAAVAVILCETRQGAELLLVERARRPGDPWSGDVALPGGRLGAADGASASAAACRETREETGIALTRSHGIGRLRDRITLTHHRRAPMIVSPFVYRLPAPPRLVLNHELADALWTPLARLDEPAHRARLRWRIGALSLSMGCCDCGGGRRLWGLTLGMVDELLSVARRSLP